MQDILSTLKAMSPSELSEAVSRAKAFMSTPEGRQAVEKLRQGQPVEGLSVTAGEQSELISQLSKNPQMAKRVGELFGNK